MEADDAQSKQRLLQHLANQKATKQLFRDELGLPTDDIDEDIKETQRKLARLSEGGLDAAPDDAADARLREHEHRQTLAALAKTQGEAGAQSHIPRPCTQLLNSVARRVGGWAESPTPRAVVAVPSRVVINVPAEFHRCATKSSTRRALILSGFLGAASSTRRRWRRFRWGLG